MKLVQDKRIIGLSEKSEVKRGINNSIIVQVPIRKKAVDFDLLKLTNWMLAIIAVGLLGYIFIKYSHLEQHGIVTLRSHEVELAETNLSKREIFDAETKPFRFYQESLEQRDIFQAPWENPKMPADLAGNSDLELNKHIRLVGIVVDDDPKAIVEDLKEKQTLFMSEGERIGSALLKEIREDKVIFSYNNENVELVP